MKRPAVALQAGIARRTWWCPFRNCTANNVGVLAGRLCDRSVSIADSPMRVATGSGVRARRCAGSDSAAAPLSLATLETLASATV